MNSAFALAIAAVSASTATYLFLNPKSGQGGQADLSALNNLLKDIDAKLADGRLSQEAADADRQKILDVMMALSTSPASAAVPSGALRRLVKNPSAIAAAAVAAVAMFVFAAAEDEATSISSGGQSGHEQIAANAAPVSGDKDPAVSQLQAYARAVQGDNRPAPAQAGMAPAGAAAPAPLPADAGKTIETPMSKRPMGMMAPGTPMAADGGKQPLADVDTMIGRLASRMEKDPNNADGWRMLGWSYLNTRNYKKAAEAYGRAAALKPDSMAYKAGYAEALVKAADDVVTPEAAAAFDAVLVVEPGNTRAIYFKGLAKEQSGDKKGALEYWTASLKAAAPDVEWAAEVKGRIEKLSGETGAPVANQEPAKAAEPVKVEEAAKAAEPASIPQEAPKQPEAAKEAPAEQEAVKAPEPAAPTAPAVEAQPAAAQAPAKTEEAPSKVVEPAKAAAPEAAAPAQAVAPASEPAPAASK
jgi:tetratricopeptide (TPR) repeat protein